MTPSLITKNSAPKLVAILKFYETYSQATDLDSEDSSLRYIITFAPQHGMLNITKHGVVRRLTAGDNFTQADIDAGRVSYTHTGTRF